MNKDLLEFKRMLVGTGLFVKKNNDWYQGKMCPYCGDCKNHYRIHIGMDDSPISQYCFKCNVKGCVNEKMLECYGIDWKGSIPRGKGGRSIRNSDDYKNFILKDEEIDMGYAKKCAEYIEGRLGIEGISLDDLKTFGCILNPNIYARMYLGDDGLTDWKDRVWFMTSNGMLLCRNMSKKKDGWEKYSGKSDNSDRMLYNVKITFDLYEDINVCICEGVMDCLGLLYHGGIKNGLYVAVLGRDYMAGIDYVMSKGIFGDSVHVRVYKDSDVGDVRLDKLKCQFFKSVDIYCNSIGKDYGVPFNEIELSKLENVWSV